MMIEMKDSKGALQARNECVSVLIDIIGDLCLHQVPNWLRDGNISTELRSIGLDLFLFCSASDLDRVQWPAANRWNHWPLMGTGCV